MRRAQCLVSRPLARATTVVAAAGDRRGRERPGESPPPRPPPGVTRDGAGAAPTPGLCPVGGSCVVPPPPSKARHAPRTSRAPPPPPKRRRPSARGCSLWRRSPALLCRGASGPSRMATATEHVRPGFFYASVCTPGRRHVDGAHAHALDRRSACARSRPVGARALCRRRASAGVARRDAARREGG